jgi:hypothetical protein
MLFSHLVLCILGLGLASSDTANDLPKDPASNHSTLLRKGLTSAPDPEESSAASWPIIVPLTRQLVPVTNKVGTMVSYKSAFFGTISLGEDSSQTFEMVFDTGSSQVIVPSSKCKSEACLKHRRFDRASSSSAVDIEANGDKVTDEHDRDTVVVGFGTGQVVGEFVKETMCLGRGADNNAHCTEDLKLISATEMSDKPFASFTFDGVVGLALPVGAVHPTFSFLHMLSSSGAPHPQMGIFVDGRNGPNSEISFGGVNTRRLRSPLQWAKVMYPEHGHWQIPLKGIRVGGVAVDLCGNEECKAIVDTGTSHLGVPSSIHASLQQSLTSRHSFGSIQDCRESTEMPEVEIDLGEFTLTLGAQEYLKRVPVLASNFNQSVAGNQDGICWPQIMKLNLGPPMGPNTFILGEPVLRKYYSAFDWVENKVGFALSSQLEEDQEEVISLVQVRVTLRRSRKKVSFAVEMEMTSLAPCDLESNGFIPGSPLNAQLHSARMIA